VSLKNPKFEYRAMHPEGINPKKSEAVTQGFSLDYDQP
jgi:hypothetical protein